MAKPKWISVEERLPNGKCLAVSKYGEFAIGYINGSTIGYCCEYGFETTFDITHWMPLPEPPKE